MQLDLNNSESVQKDFVKLSQQLQVSDIILITYNLVAVRAACVLCSAPARVISPTVLQE